MAAKWQSYGDTTAADARKVFAKRGVAPSFAAEIEDVIRRCSPHSRVALGFAYAESQFGQDTDVNPLSNRNILNHRSVADPAWAFGGLPNGAWMKYPDHAQCFYAWKQRLLNPIYKDDVYGPARDGTLLDVIEIYAPRDDGNDPVAYEGIVQTIISELPRSGAPPPQPTGEKITYRAILDPNEKIEPTVSQGFGSTPFARSTCEVGSPFYHMYWYGKDGGLDGCSHPAEDWSMPRGTQVYSPVNGVVEVAGGTPYYTFYGDGSPGVGELSIITDSGDRLTLGHMMKITVEVGQRVKPGDKTGLSGGYNGDHLHVETRKKKQTYVDPRTYDYGTRATEPPPPPPTPGKRGKVPYPPIIDVCIEKDVGVGRDPDADRNIVGTVVHTMVGTFDGNLGWFQRKDVAALTDYGVAYDGRIHRYNCLPRQIGWASGPARAPNGDGKRFVDKYGVAGVNRHLRSIEHEGDFDDPVSEAMWRASCWLQAAIHSEEADQTADTYDWNIHHYEFTGKEYKLCPGSRFEQYTTQYQDFVKAIMRYYQDGAPLAASYRIGGVDVRTAGMPKPSAPQPTPPPKPDPQPQPQPTPDKVPAAMKRQLTRALKVGLTEDEIRRQFGTTVSGYAFDLDGAVSLIWLTDGLDDGELSPLVRVSELSPTNRWFWFQDGTGYRWDGKRINRLRQTGADDPTVFGVKVEADERPATTRNKRKAAKWTVL